MEIRINAFDVWWFDFIVTGIPLESENEVNKFELYWLKSLKNSSGVIDFFSSDFFSSEIPNIAFLYNFCVYQEPFFTSTTSKPAFLNAVR